METRTSRGSIRRRNLALLLLFNLIKLTASQNPTTTTDAMTTEETTTTMSPETTTTEIPTESPTNPTESPTNPTQSPTNPTESPTNPTGGPNPPTTISPGVPPPPPPSPPGVQLYCTWTTAECQNMGPGYCSMSEVKEEFFNRTYQEGGETKVIPPGEDIPDGVGEHQIHCKPMSFHSMTKNCICVGDLVIPKGNFSRVRSTINQAKPKSKSRHGRQVDDGFCQQTKSTPCVSRYLNELINTILALPPHHTITNGSGDEGARCDPEREALLSDILVDLQMYPEFPYRTLDKVHRLTAPPFPPMCNRRRLMSCNPATGTCGCTDGGPLPPHQSTPTGHRFITSRGVTSYYCYATGGTCNLDPVEVMPQFPEVARQVKAHYGDPLVPTHLDDMGCLKNLCAWVKEGEKVCSPQETGPG